MEAEMGELIVMPVGKHQALETIESEVLERKVTETADLSVWKNAPKERTAAYFPTYSAISRAMQRALRGWVRDWFTDNAETILLRPHTAYSILVYQCTHPFSGKPTNTFTYDIQQTDVLDRAFVSAVNKLGGELRMLDTKRFSWFTREHYFAYRSKDVVNYVTKNRRAIYRMLHTETVLMDSILKFAIMDIPKLGMDDAVALLRRTFHTQMRRFSKEFNLSPHADELLQIITDELMTKLAADAVVPFPQAA
jgi:hypothetical protein